MHGRFELVGGQASVVGQRHPLLLDPGRREGTLDRRAVARAVLVVLGQVEHAADPHPREHLDVVRIERVGADQQVIEHIGEAV